MTDETTENTSTSNRLQQAILVGLGMMLVLVPLYFSPSMSDYHTPKFILVQVFATILGCLLLISMVLGQSSWGISTLSDMTSRGLAM